MKTPIARHIIPIVCLLALAGTIRSQADSGTYTNYTTLAEDPIGLWSGATNWLNDTVADGSGNIASFSNDLSATLLINMDSSRTVGGLDFQQGIFTIDNNTNDANVLTLAGPSKPVINVLAGTGTPATLRGVVIAGTQGLVVDGGGQLNFYKDQTDPANTFTGGIIITNNSTLQITSTDVNSENTANTIALNGVGPITFGNGTLNLRPPQHTSFGNGVVNNDLIVPSGQVGTIFLPVRFSGDVGDNSATPGTGLGGTLTGGGTFNVNVRYVRGAIVGDWSAFTGQINVAHDTATDGGVHDFRVGNPAGLPNASVELGGSLNFNFHYYRQLTSNTVYSIGAVSGANALASLVGSDSAAFTLFYSVGAKHSNSTDSAMLNGPIVNGAGPAGLIKRGAGTLILNGANTYTGATIISNGVLQLGDGGETVTMAATPITNLSALTINRGGTMTIRGTIAGSGALTNIGSGVVTLAGTNVYTGPTTITAGKLMVSTALRFTNNTYIVGDGAGLGVLVNGTGRALTNGSITFGSGCSYDFDLSGFGNPTGTVATDRGNLTLNGSDVTVNILGTNFQAGIITLFSYTNRVGAGNFVLGTLPPNISSATLDDDVANKRVRLNIATVFYPPDTTLRYVGDSAGIWDIDNLANQIWVERLTSRTTNYYEGAPVLFDDSATGTNNITVSTTVNPGQITVSNSVIPYTLSGPGSIGGFGGVIKLGTNKLTIANLGNLWSGDSLVDGATLEIGDGVNSGSFGTGPIILSNNATIVLNSGGANSGIGVTLANVISGAGTVVQVNTSASGLSTLSGNSTFSGGVTVKPGATLALNNGNAAGIGGGITVDGGTISLGSDVAANVGTVRIITNGTFTATANRVVNTPIVGTNVTVTFSKTALITLNADISGLVGVITNDSTGLLRFNSGGGNPCFGSSNVLFVLNAGTFLQNRNGGNIDLGAVIGTGTIGSPQNANNNTVNFRIGGLNTSTVFEGTINDNGTNANNRLTGMEKVGTGTLTLSNAVLTYFGPTTVSAGILKLMGSGSPTNSSDIILNGGVLDVTGLDAGALRLGESMMFGGFFQPTNRVQTIRGNGGIVQGTVLMGTQGRLEPGAAGNNIGVVTNVGTITLGGTNIMQLDTASTPSSDRLASTGGITYGGTLIITNIGGAVAGTKVFQLFSGPVSGSFSTIVTQAIPSVTWDLTQLNVNGSISLVGSIPTTPTDIEFSTSGTNLTLQWPQDYTGWTLQTNSVGITNSEAWFSYPGSSGTNQVTLGFDQTKTNVFFRLRLIP